MSTSTELYGIHILKLPLETQKRIAELESERSLSGLDEEQFLIERLKRSRLNNLIAPKSSFASDNGVDFAVQFDGIIYIGQLKWWRHPINLKQTKAFFGEMFFSPIAHTSRSENKRIIYLLLAPIIGRPILSQLSKFNDAQCKIIHAYDFVRFMTNPYFFLNNQMGAEGNESKYHSE